MMKKIFKLIVVLLYKRRKSFEIVFKKDIIYEIFNKRFYFYLERYIFGLCLYTDSYRNFNKKILYNL